MKNTNTFGVHFTLRHSRQVHGKSPVYVRADWNTARGLAKPKNDELKQLNTYLEDVRARIITIIATWNGRKW